MNRRIPVAARCAGVLTLLALSPAPLRAGDAPAPVLEDLGARLEEARRLPPAEAGEAIDGILRVLDDNSLGRLPSERRGAGRFLLAETLLAAGDGERARSEFEKAARSSGKEPFDDDAAFGAIRGREVAGDDVGAAKEWDKWLGRNPSSPLRPEALLASAWNAVRRDSLRVAAATLETLRQESPWMQSDPRVSLAGAAVAYLVGQSAEALAILADVPPSEGTEYLRGLALRARGEMLPAAARFQDVAQRWPDSPLRDPAMLAKADVFLASRAWRSAAEEFGRVAAAARQADVRAEAELRQAAAVFLGGDVEGGLDRLRSVAAAHRGTPVAARAQYLLGEGLYSQSRFGDAIVEYNRVLTDYFHEDLAARAQYRVGRALDALGRPGEATAAYQAVVSGYSQAPESPAAAYLAGVGLLESGRPLAAAPYFRLVLDRYASESEGALVFASPEHLELVEAALCLLEMSYHRAGDLGALAGVPHLMLAKMPPSDSGWRAWALLVDADALASLGRYEEAQGVLDRLLADFEKHPVAIPANRLLAWTYARTGRDDLAIAVEERMLNRHAARGDAESLASAVLNKAHILFNEKKYAEAAKAYDDFARRFPENPQISRAQYQAGLCHLRLGRAGDAVDRWEAVVARDPSGELGAKAWARAGDVYFRAEQYEDAKRCFAGLLEHVEAGPTAARATLRIAQCEYNAGRDAEALRGFSEVVERWAGTPAAAEAERGIELALYRLGQRTDGGEVLADLVERFPGSSFAADAQFEIARRAYDAKEWTAAADAFRRVVTQFPSYSAADRAQYLMGDCHERADDAILAREAYEQFLHFFPGSELRPAVQFRVATLRFADGDYAQAAVDFSAALASETSEETREAALYNLALCQIQLGMAEEANVSLQKFRAGVGADDPRLADAAYRLGELHERAGRFAEAITEYDRALSGKPAAALAAELHYRIGTCREGLGQGEAATAAYRTAAKTGEHGSAFRLSALARLAALYEASGKYRDAAGVYRELIRDSDDEALVSAAKERVAQLESMPK